ncbi:hypothetical protein [Heliophilum fasciatum]|uniref:Uncharacterized protein n=1 Tax=Heliophilum fasciatum TaxID=35700 RepID=A0A4V2SX29_9FIRM|nr:hypothetical protein [Heliophilum fasciatum]MCW2277974.1 hypothetical protein [Heliophilum fasciatum]TCP64406.1 hypothetical protein EDD73_110105 [Heliophilum fasciatum]
MKHNPVLSAFERVQAMNSLKGYQRLLREEMSKPDPSFDVVKYYRQRLDRCQQILHGR